MGVTGPWKDVSCGIGNCLVCVELKEEIVYNEKPTDLVTNEERQVETCTVENVCYKIVCENCRYTGKKSFYYGETSRNLYIRGIEHQAERKLRKDESVLYKHDSLFHRDLPNGAK